jgi:hypothetical protein
MKFTAFASLLAAASAAPSKRETAATNPFQLMSLRSASPLHFGSLSAADGNIYVNYPKDQGAACDGDARNLVTFTLKDGSLYLYNSDAAKQQQIYVDRSGMGEFRSDR